MVMLATLRTTKRVIVLRDEPGFRLEVSTEILEPGLGGNPWTRRDGLEMTARLLVAELNICDMTFPA